MSLRTKMCVSAGLGLSLVLVACGGAENNGDEDTDNGPVSGDQDTSLVVGSDQEPPTYDYTESPFGVIPMLLMLNVVEPLLDKAEDGSLEPLLAESYEVSDDGTEYVFTLREATFHDGSEFTADDVVYSLELYQDAVNETLSAPLADVESVEAVDDRTVRVTLPEPSQRFLEAMAGISGMIIAEDSADQLNDGPVGTGPFVFEEWSHGVDVSLAQFDDYWGETPFFEDVTWRFIEDQTARVNAFVAGELDIGPGGSNIESVAGEIPDDVEVVQTGGQIILFMFLNAESEKFDDPRVRQAIAHAINREEITAANNQPDWPTTCTFVNPLNVPWGTDYCPYPYDPERAQELLAEAGAEDLTVDFKYVTGDDAAPDVIASQLEAVGITVERTPLDGPTMVEQTQGGDFEVGYLGGSEQIDAFMCPPWFSGDCVPEFDEMLTEADRLLDREEWANLRREAVEFHADRAYVIPTFVASLEISVRGLAGVKPYRSYNEIDLRGLHWAEE